MYKKIIRVVALVCCLGVLWLLFYRPDVDRAGISVRLPNGLDFEFEKRFKGKSAIDNDRRVRFSLGGKWHDLAGGIGASTSLRLTWRDEAEQLILDDDFGTKWLFDCSNDSLWLINQDTEGVVFRTPADSKNCTPFDAINDRVFYGPDAVEIPDIEGRFIGEIQGKYPLKFVEP